MDEFASVIGDLEIRASKGARKLRGRFPYKKLAVLSDGGKNGGRPQKEQFLPGAFTYSLESTDQEIHLLVGHDFNKPLASKNTGTLTFSDSKEALSFDADVSPQIADTSYGADVLKQIDSGLAVGISPGFRIPPKRAVAVAEKFEDEGHDPAKGKHNAVIRTIIAAVLFELSVVTRPAYSEASVQLASELSADELEKLLADGWTLSPEGVLIPPPQKIIKRNAILRYR